MIIKRLLQLGVASVLSLSSLLSIYLPTAHAATGQTLTWCGANSANFSTATNWAVGNAVSCSGNSNTTAYPGSDGSSDTLVFDLANVPSGSSMIATDDISSLTVSTIEFTGGDGSTNGYGYDISGSNTIAVTSGVTDNSIPSGGTALGGNILNPTIDVGSSGSSVTFNINTGSSTTFVSVKGSDNITVQGGGTAVFSTTGSASSLANYTGTISSSDGSRVQIANDLSGTFSSSGTVAVSGTSILDLLGGSCKISLCKYTYDLPISLGGSGTGKDSALNLDGYQSSNIDNILAGPVTLTTNIAVSETTGISSTTLDITGPVHFGSYYIKTPLGPNIVTVNVPSGTDDSSYNPNIGQNVTYTDDGTVGNTTVDSGGILKGSGTMASTTVQSGGNISPGHSPGCLTDSGNFTLSGTYTAEIQSPGKTACTDYDQLIVSGTINLNNGTLDTKFLNGYSPSVGQSFEIIKNQGGSAISGTFNGLAEGAVFSVGTTKLQITYKGAGGNNVVLTVVNPTTPTTATPGTPDTGLGLVAAHPWTTLAASIVTAFSLVVIARRLKPVKQ